MTKISKIFCFLPFSLLLLGDVNAQDSITIFKNVHVVSMESPEIQESRSVVIKNGVVAQIDTITRILLPKNALIIDGTGKYLMPGLADMHAHLTHPGATYFAEDNIASMHLLLAHGVTTIRNMWGSADLLEFIKTVNNGKIMGPRIYTAGPLIVSRPDTMPAPWNPNEVEKTATELYARTVEDGRAIAKYHAAMGYDFIKVHNNTTLQPYIGVINEGAAPVIGHAPRSIGLAKVLTTGKQSSLEHYDALVALAENSASEAKKSPNWYDQYFGSYSYADDERILLLATLLKSAGIYVTPTIFVSKWYNASQSKMLTRLEDPDLIRYTSRKQRAIWYEYANGFALYYDQWKLDMTNQRTFAFRLVNLLHNAGVSLLLGTDATPAMGIQGISAVEELELFVEAGLTPFEAIKTGTVNAHSYLLKSGLASGKGMIVVGEPADLILLENNPLADVKHIREISGVMTKGRWLPKNKLLELKKEAENIYSRQ